MQRICNQLDLNYQQLQILPLDAFSYFCLGKITETAMRCSSLGKKFLIIGIEGRSDSLEFSRGCFLPIREMAGAILISNDAQVRICFLRKSHTLAMTHLFSLVEDEDSDIDFDPRLAPITEETELGEEGFDEAIGRHSGADLRSIAEEPKLKEETEGLGWSIQGPYNLEISKLKNLFEGTHPRFIKAHFPTKGLTLNI